MKGETGLGIDSNRLVHRAISISGNRDQYFNDLIRKFKETYPGLKIIYANNTMGARLDPEHPQPDFVIVVKGVLMSKDPKKPNRDVIIVDAPMMFTDRSIAGWTIAVESGNMKGYFDYMLDKALRIDLKRFNEYIEHMALLSLDPNNALYWKKIENTEAFTSNIAELYARYSKNKPTKLQDQRGYKQSPASK